MHPLERPGVSSDIMYRKYRLQRLWLIVASASIFSLAQLCAVTVENPNWLWLVSSLSGLGYGVMFGVYPTIVSELIPECICSTLLHTYILPLSSEILWSLAYVIHPLLFPSLSIGGRRGARNGLPNTPYSSTPDPRYNPIDKKSD